MRMVSKETVVLRRWEIGTSFFKGVAIIVASAKQEGFLRAYRAPVAQLVEHRAVTKQKQNNFIDSCTYMYMYK